MTMQVSTSIVTIPGKIYEAACLVRTELLYRANKRRLEKIYNIYMVDMLVRADFFPGHPVQLLIWIHDLGTGYQAQITEWIEANDWIIDQIKEIVRESDNQV